MSKFKVVVTDLRHKNYDAEKKVLDGVAELVLKDCRTPEEVIELAEDADGVLVNLAPFGAEVLNALQKCRVVSRYGVGYDNVDVKTATEKKIYVTNVPDYCEEDVSDQAIALMLSCVRKTVIRTNKIRQGKWFVGEDEQVFRIKGKSFGFIGFGRIAKTFFRKLKGFNLENYFVYDPFLKKETAEKEGLLSVDLDTLLRKSDFVSLHAPLTNETEGLLGTKQFEIMKENAILINTSRGPLVDEKALYSALKSGKINSAGLDVFHNEPVEKDNPLLTLENVVLSDHHGWYSEESFVELKMKAAQNVRDVLEGRKPKYPVNDF